jgi:small-conductance mechanosensitive channel
MTIFRIAAIAVLGFVLVVMPETSRPALSAPAGDAASPAAAAPKASPPAAKPRDEELPSVPAPAFPQAQSKLDSWKDTLDTAERALRLRGIADATLTDLRERVAPVQSEARDLIGVISPRLEEASARAAELAPNANDATPQSDDIKLERAKLLAEVAARQGIIQQAKLINVRAQQSLDAISDRRRMIFTDSVLQRSPSLINPSFWVTLVGVVPQAASKFGELLSRWMESMTSQPLRALSGFAIAAVVLLVFFLSPGRRWQSRWTNRDPEIEHPGALRKTGSAAAIVLAGTVIPGVSLFVLYQSLVALGVLPYDIAAIARALFAGVIFAFFFSSLATAVLAPGRPSWRLIDVDDRTADGIVPLALLLGIVAAAGLLLDATNLAIGAPAELTLVSQAAISLAKAFLFMAVLRVAAGVIDDDSENEDSFKDTTKRSAWRLLVPLGWVTSAATVLGSLLGYIAFGRFVSAEMIVATAVLMSFVLLSQLSDASIAAAFAYQGRVGRFLRQTAGLGSAAVRQIAALLSGFMQLALIALAAFMVLATWGINSDDLLGSISSAFFGFTVGKFIISPSAILGAIVVLVVGMAATRAIQKWLEGRFLPETNLDVGVRSSIRTGVGYIGVIMAVFVALSYVGLNLQNVAIVAGALSVGIGFGLQSIINNFVSGLILLVERPIKVGDRIEVGARMGVVKRINVRATEIATYDNVSVIVPNADLISGQVVNWMHGSYTARLSVMVGTSYEADLDRVIAILLEIVGNNARALKTPEPFAILGNFGADALEFTVFFHVANISVDAGAANEVRLEVLKRFRQEGIEIPFAQRDLRLRDLDRIEALVRDFRGQSGNLPRDVTDKRAVAD